MCVDEHAHPPIPVVAGGSGGSISITLESADGTSFLAHAARAAKPSGAGMIVLPDVRGLHAYYRELADRFSEHGIDAVAIDYFARTAPDSDRSASFDYQQHVRRTASETTTADIAAATAYLRSPAGGEVKRIFTIGFCFGGMVSSLQAAAGHGLSGVVSFYGWPEGLGFPGWQQTPGSMAAAFTCPVLAIYGGADEGIPKAVIGRYDQALEAAGVEHTTLVFPGAPHSFFDRSQAQFADVSQGAWEAVLAFVQEH